MNSTVLSEPSAGSPLTRYLSLGVFAAVMLVAAILVLVVATLSGRSHKHLPFPDTESIAVSPDSRASDDR